MNEQSQGIRRAAVIYCRVSTMEQVEEGNSLVTQEKACREYAGKNGFSIGDDAVFIERGESAKTTDRPQIQKLLLYCSQKKKGIAAVIVYKIDRLSRNTDDYSQLRLLLKRYGVEIKSTTEHFGDTPIGRFMENTMANIAQFDNDVRAERCSNGMREALIAGRYPWGAPIGYVNGAILNGRPTIAPDDMAPLVLKSFELVATGLYPIKEVWRMMVVAGLKVKSGKSVSQPRFYEILQDRLYIARTDKFGESFEGAWAPIVDDALFERVQGIFRNKGKIPNAYKRDNPDFPLRRFVFSPTGLKLTGSWVKHKHPYYRFGMKGSNFNRDEFEEKFTAHMDSYSFDGRQVERLKFLVREKFNKSTDGERKNMRRLHARMEELCEQETVLVGKNLKGVIPDAVLRKQLELIAKERIDTQAGLAIAGNSDTSPEEAVAFAEEYLRTPSAVWKKTIPTIKTKLQWFQFPSGVVFDGEKFGTAQIASVFKARELIEASSSSSVDPARIELASPHCK